MFRADFHLHTHHSDGTLSPEELLEALRKADVTHFAITDHDSVAAIQFIQSKNLVNGFKMFAGVEINTSDSDEALHILGFGSQIANSPTLEGHLERFRSARKERAVAIVDKLKSAGVPIRFEDVEAKSKDTIGRPNIADAMVQLGVVNHRRNAFQQFLLPGKPAYVQPLGPTPEEAIEVIRDSGGVAVLAHPGVASIDDKKLSSLFQAGLRGIEVYHPMHSRDQVELYKSWAAKWHLYATCGSDYHGPKSGREELLDYGVQEKDLASFMEAIN